MAHNWTGIHKNQPVQPKEWGLLEIIEHDGLDNSFQFWKSLNQYINGAEGIKWASLPTCSALHLVHIPWTRWVMDPTHCSCLLVLITEVKFSQFNVSFFRKTLLTYGRFELSSPVPIRGHLPETPREHPLGKLAHKEQVSLCLLGPFLVMLKTAFVAGLFCFASTEHGRTEQTRGFIENWDVGDAEESFLFWVLCFSLPLVFSPNWAIPAGYPCFITINSFMLLWGVFFFMQRTLRILIFFNAKTFMWPKCRQVLFLLWFNCNFFSWRIFVFSFPLCAEFEEWVLLINLLFCVLISSSFILRDFFGMCLDHEFKLSYKTLRVWFCLL